MRISTLAAYESNLNSLQQRQRKLSDTHEHLSSQLRVMRPSDDPAAAARAERAQAQITRGDAQQRAIEASRNAMTQTESTLGDANELLLQAQTVMIQAGSSLTDDQRSGLAQQLQSVRSQLLTLANRDDGTGNYVFGGTGAAGTPPFSDGPNGVVYNGAGSAQNSSTEGLPLTLNGAAAWVQAADGNGYFTTAAAPATASTTQAWIDGGRLSNPAAFFAATSPPLVADPSQLKYQVQFSNTGGSMSYTLYKDVGDGSGLVAQGAAQAWKPGTDGQDIEIDGMRFTISGAPQNGDLFDVRLSQPQQNIFTTLDKAITALQTPAQGNAQRMQAVGDALTGLERSMTALGTLRSRAGDALNLADSAEDRVGRAKLQNQQLKSDAEDLDVLQAFSDFQLQQTGYDAALKAYSSVQKLSLFQYIGG